MLEQCSYTASVIEGVKHGPGIWDSIKVGVLEFKGENALPVQVGEYIRHYDLLETFFPFMKGDKWYALYSPDYTATRLMELPSCKDIGGEKSNDFGFCPVEYYVPKYIKRQMEFKGEKITYRVYEPDGENEEEKYYQSELLYLPFGFIAGCIWGDDSSWKIQYIDLSQVDKGILKRDDRFGYIELPPDMRLKDAIEIMEFSGDKDPPRIMIATERCYNLADGKEL